MPNVGTSTDGVYFRASDGTCLWGTVRRLGQFHAAFDIFSESCGLRVSESLKDLTIVLHGREFYKGRAVVRGLLHTGPTWACEVELSEQQWQDPIYARPAVLNGALQEAFSDFLRHWAEAYQVLPSYKSVIADMHTFFSGLRIWLDQLEAAQKTYQGTSPHADLNSCLPAIAEKVVPCVNELFRRFEACCSEIPPELLPAHRSYMRRQLHALTLCAPFAHRTFHKPLGYAGDYEMVNMIVRNGWEGSSFYAQIVNKWFLLQPPAEAHRNRITYLTESLISEASRVMRLKRPLRVLSLGCGPAHEVQRFLKLSPLSKEAHITLLDFDRETIDHVTGILRNLEHLHHRSAELCLVQESVFQLLKEGETEKDKPAADRYDLAYCAGLFDYLADSVCRKLLAYMFRRLESGGLLIATNVHPSNPLRNGMEHLLDWHLIHRNARDMLALAADLRELGEARVLADPTGVNVFLEIRKPER